MDNNWTKFFDDIIEEDTYLDYLMRTEDEDTLYYLPGNAGKTMPTITRILVKGPAVITFWSDNTKTVSKYNIEKEFNEYNVMVPVLLNIVKKFFNRKHVTGLLSAIEETNFDKDAASVFAKWDCCNVSIYQYCPDEIELVPTKTGWSRLK